MNLTMLLPAAVLIMPILTAIWIKFTVTNGNGRGLNLATMDGEK